MAATLLCVGLICTQPPEATAQANHPLRDARERAIECIAITVYAESRGEPPIGKSAVAWTIMNRARSTGADPCTVVLQRDQFIAINIGPVQDYLRAVAHGRAYALAAARGEAERVALDEARLVARLAYHGVGVDPSNGALNFIAADWENRVSPGHWSRTMRVTARIAGHIFMRPIQEPQQIRTASRTDGQQDGIFSRRLSQVFGSLFNDTPTMSAERAR